MHPQAAGARVCDPQQLRQSGSIRIELWRREKFGRAAAHRAALRERNGPRLCEAQRLRDTVRVGDYLADDPE